MFCSGLVRNAVTHGYFHDFELSCKGTNARLPEFDGTFDEDATFKVLFTRREADGPGFITPPRSLAGS